MAELIPGNPLGGSIETAELADGAVTTAKLAATAVTTAKIAASAVTATELGTNAVTTAKINDKAVTAAKLDDEIRSMSSFSVCAALLRSEATQTNTGSGGGSQATIQSVNCDTGTTASSTVRFEWGFGNQTSPVAVQSGMRLLDWDKDFEITFKCACNTSNTEGVGYVKLTDVSDANDLSDRGIGIKVSNLGIALQVHDGTTLNNVSGSHTMTADDAVLVRISKIGTTVKLFVNNTQISSTSTNVPAGDSDDVTCVAVVSAKNGATAARYHLTVSSISITTT